MAEHKYAQALRWLADGKTVEARLPGVVTAAEWDKVSEHSFTEGWFQCLVLGDFQGSDWEFRLKPCTVKIGNREVEAPVLEPEDGQVVFRAVEDEDFAERVEYCEHYRRIAQEGRYFLSGEAALAARAATHALLRGESC